ncbi:MAG: hypothetical protein Q9227_002749 [Pyrenula ochraceoflavens]
MPPPPKKRAKSPANVAASDLVAFNNAAAGHEGVLSNTSGSLIFKPCTPSEISFYESAASHPRFQALMPTFMGTLSNPTDPTTNSLLQSVVQQAQTSTPGAPADPDGAAIPITPAVLEQVTSSASAATTAKPVPPSSDDDDREKSKPKTESAGWTPSGGAKINTQTSIVLENITHPFTSPNILDLKLGARLWDDAAPAEKRKKLDDVSASTTSSSLGFRVAGMKVFVGHQSEQDTAAAGLVNSSHISISKGYRSYDKYYGRQFKDQQDVQSAFTEFLYSAKQHKPLLASRILSELEEIKDTLEKEESRMYSASVLIVYEGDVDALEKRVGEEEEVWREKAGGGGDGLYRDDEGREREEEGEEDEEDEEEERPRICDVKLIDFAHASWTPGLGPDENALQGVRSLVEIFRGIAREIGS